MSQDPNDMESVFNAAAGVAPTQSAPQPPRASSPGRAGNQVFAEQNKVTEVSREEYARKEFGLEIPVDAVPLPSRGLAYPAGHPLHLADFVEYRAMTTREEDILMSRPLIKKGTAIKELIKSCLTDKSIDVSSLLSGDQVALMLAIRSTGYGTMYEPEATCPKCEAKTQMHISLDELDIKSLDIEPDEEGSNLFDFTLPTCGKRIKFRFSTVADEEAIIKEVEAKRKRGLQNENMVSSKLLSSIVSIDGNDNRSDIAKFVSYMPAKDSRALRNYIEDHEPGIKMEVEFQCVSCDHEDDIALPMGSEFFWPGTRR